MEKLGFLIRHKISEKRLLLLGYKKVPTHSYSLLEVDGQWVQGVDNFGNAHFPRYHILKKNKDWYIHCDWNKEHENIWDTGKIVEREIWRIEHLFTS